MPLDTFTLMAETSWIPITDENHQYHILNHATVQIVACYKQGKYEHFVLVEEVPRSFK